MDIREINEKDNLKAIGDVYNNRWKVAYKVIFQMNT